MTDLFCLGVYTVCTLVFAIFGALGFGFVL